MSLLLLGAIQVLILSLNLTEGISVRQGVVIESAVAGLDGWTQSEYICIYNNTQQRFNLAGWKMVYYELPTEKILYTHNFVAMNERSGFDPKERLRLISDYAIDHFHTASSELQTPCWDIYTDESKNILNHTPSYKVSLFDGAGNELDSLSVAHYRTVQELKMVLKQPVIFIGHGSHQEWRTLKEHLQDKHGLTCIAFETEERAGITIPDIISELGKAPDIALLVLTGEDKTDKGKLRARQNVIHELGLFGGVLDKNRIIPLVEHGVEVPSNISGI